MVQLMDAPFEIWAPSGFVIVVSASQQCQYCLCACDHVIAMLRYARDDWSCDHICM